MKINLAICILAILTCFKIQAQVTVTIDSTIKYQTIEGWGHGGSLFSSLGSFYSLSDTTFANELSIDYLDYLIDELGLTGSRIWEVGPRTDGTGMDNGDCDSLDWTKFQDNAFFPWHHPYIKYFSDRIKAKGYEPSFYSSPTYPTFATAFKPWVLNHPGERAQQMLGNSLFWKNKYDIDMNYAVIYNEPGSPVTTAILVDDAKAVGSRFISHGLKTKVQYAEAVTPGTNWGFITPVQNDSDLWQNIGRISYHNYGNYNSPDQYRPLMRDFANSLGITTSQTEMGDPTFDNLYSDLILGGVSYWEVAFSGGNTLPMKSGNTQFGFGSKYFRLRQLLHYVRPGNIRISSISNDTNLHALAFNNNGKITTILESITTPMTVIVSGLPPGTYGISQSAGQPYQELGLRNVGADGKLTVDVMGGSGTTTIYPYSGQNQPPTIISYGTDKGYIFAPTSSVNLSVIAVDEELDKLTYQWTVFRQPPGTNAIISTPKNTTSAVNNLDSSGLYIFKIDVSDGKNVSSKKVFLYKYDANPPAMIGQAGFRFAQPYGLVFANFPDTTHANIELPTSSCMLQVGVGDLAGSDFTGRGKWTLVSAPNGSNVKVDSTIYIYISIRAQVTGMNIPGDYVFHVEITNPPYKNLSTDIICTLHPASSAPVISSITTSPATLTLPTNTTLLTAKTSDPENDLLRHWWAIKSVPAGAKPIFDHQGLPISNVSGLTVPGTYVFTLRCFDDLHETTKDITIKVNNASSVDENNIINQYLFKICPNPATDLLKINFIGTELQIPYTIKIINELGIIVWEKFYFQPELNEIEIDTRCFPAGSYFCIIKYGNKFEANHFFIIR